MMVRSRQLFLIASIMFGGLLYSFWRRQQQYVIQIQEEAELKQLLSMNRITNFYHLSHSKSALPPALVYIPTREGLTSRFRQLERMHSNALARNRNLTIIDNHSVHYKDLGRICLCEIFVLPPTIQCSSAPIEKAVAALKCTLPPVPFPFLQESQQWLFKPSNFGLKTFDNVDKHSSFTWNSTLCTLAYGFFFNISNKSHVIPIRFQPTYVRQFQAALHNLQSSSSIDSESQQRQPPLLVVVHWRRGDQKDRCKRREDVSVNCGSVDEFIEKVHNATASHAVQFSPRPHPRERIDKAYRRAHSSNPQKLIYIATNERDASVLEKLELAGFKLFKHAVRKRKKELAASVSSLSTFLVELQLMIHADLFLGWGTTGVSQFVMRARAERVDSLQHAAS